MDKIKLLLVDDEKDVLDSFVQLLEIENDFELSSADNVTDAIKKIKSSPPHIIISDMRMPESSGSILLEKVRELYPELPVIILSGHSDESVESVMNKGANELWGKPVNMEDLIAKIHQLVKKRPLAS